MNDKEFAKQKARVVKIAGWWIDQLWLRGWNVEVKCHRGPWVGMRDAGAGFVVPADITCHWQYAEARININLEEVKDLSKEKLEKVLLHELCHAIVNEMRYWEEDHSHEERVVTHMTRAFITVRDHSRGKEKGLLDIY